MAELTERFWDDPLSVNLRPQFFAAQAVAPGMRAGGGGSIINLGSITWHIGLLNLAVYFTAKAAIEGLTRSLARDLGRDGIRVNCLIPGWTMTARQLADWVTPEAEPASSGTSACRTVCPPTSPGWRSGWRPTTAGCAPPDLDRRRRLDLIERFSDPVAFHGEVATRTDRCYQRRCASTIRIDGAVDGQRCEESVPQKFTSKDVARLAGVSQSTVSYVMSGKRPISAATRMTLSTRSKG